MSAGMTSATNGGSDGADLFCEIALKSLRYLSAGGQPIRLSKISRQILIENKHPMKLWDISN
jgi:hypothetical protein